MSPSQRVIQHTARKCLTTQLTRKTLTLIQWKRSIIPQRSLSTSSSCGIRAGYSAHNSIQSRSPSSVNDSINTTYHGPLSTTFRRLKLFSLSSLALSATLAPFMFIVESNLPSSARLALVSIALGTSGTSTGLVGWCGKPYVTALKYMSPENGGGIEGLEMTTMTLTLQPRITRVYDTYFLIDSRRPFAKWELTDKFVLPPNKEREIAPGQEETIAETFDKNNNVIGRWIVEWGENGEGTCREVGNIVRYFNVHDELLR